MNLFKSLLTIALIAIPTAFMAQTNDSIAGNWTLERCLNYAHEHNISLKKSVISKNKVNELVKKAKAAYLPSLIGSTSQTYTNQPYGDKVGLKENRYTGHYELTSSLTLFDGGNNHQTVKQNKFNAKIASLNIEVAKTNIDVAILQTYTQLIYAKETIKTREDALKISTSNRELGERQFNFGSLNSSNFSELESQEENDKYNLVTAQNTYKELQVNLKQLLEITTEGNLTIETSKISEEKITKQLPSVGIVYQYAISSRPEIIASQLQIKSDEAAIKIAKSGKMPQLSLNASVGTNHTNGNDYSFDEKIRNAWTNSVSLSMNIPIYANRTNRTNINNARLTYESSKLDLLQTRKELYKLVEGYHLNALNAQASFNAAKSQLESANKRLNYINKRFKSGSKKTVDLLTAQSNATAANEAYLQSKYTAILYNTLFNYYGGGELKY